MFFLSSIFLLLSFFSHTLLTATLIIDLFWQLPHYKGIQKQNRYMLIIILILIIICKTNAFIVILSPALALNSYFLELLIHCNWVLLLPRYLSFSVFLENFTQKEYVFRTPHKLIGLTSLSLASLTMLACLGDFIFPMWSPSLWLFLIKIRFLMLALAFSFIVSTLFFAYKKAHEARLPRILHFQLKMFVEGFLLYTVSHFILVISGTINFFNFYIFHAHPHTIFITYFSFLSCSLYYYTRRMKELRFLNVASQVTTSLKYHNEDQEFKRVIEQLNTTTSLKEIALITQAFLKKKFTIAGSKITIYVPDTGHGPPTPETTLIFTEFDNKKSLITELCSHQKILFYDELQLNNFYQETKELTSVLSFLEKINADIFIPLFYQDSLVTFIIIERNARPHKLYNNIEQEHLKIFVSYVRNTIHLLHTNLFSSFLMPTQELQEELEKTQKEIQYYREHFIAYLKKTKPKEIGIIFYDNKRFIYANAIAKQMIKINLNARENNILTSQLLSLIHQIERYHSVPPTVISDEYGHHFMVSAADNLEHTHIIFTSHSKGYY